MHTQHRTDAIAFAGMVAFGMLAPATVWVVNGLAEHDLEVPMATVNEFSGVVAPLPPLLERDRATVLDVDVIAALPLVSAVVPAPLRDVVPAPSCSWHDGQTLSMGRIRICDIERPPNGAAATLLSPIRRPPVPKARDLPSPTGLLDRSQP
jgi:hypothetical protein